MAKKSRFLTWQIFFAICAVNTASQKQNESHSISHIQSACPSRCLCAPCPSPDFHDFWAVQCNQSSIENQMDLAFAEKICSLDLSRNNIENISSVIFKNMSAVQNLTLSYNLIEVIPENTFEALKSLKYLFLDHNRIEEITEETFNGLAELKYLNLAYNNLRKWHGTLSIDLPKLQFLNIMGNSKFKIKASKEKLLVDAALKTILGATTSSKGCVQCNFSRTNVPINMLLKPKGCEYVPAYNMHLIYQFQKRFLYYESVCANPNKSCTIVLVPMSKVRKTYRNFCWEKTRSLRPIEYFLGVVAMVFNLVVIVTILSNRCLIKKTSMFFTAQLAFGDLLLAVFSLTIANGHGIMSDPGLRRWRENQCPYFRSLLILGQSIEAFTSLLMTLERYLVIVHCMRPNLRVTSKVARFLSALVFMLSASVCFVIQLFDSPLIKDNYMCVLIQFFRVSKRMLASQILMLVFVAIYVAVVGMYVHIYIFVRKSAQSAGIQRETALAKRISIIVFSNMVFYAVPNLSIVVFSAANIRLPLDRAVDFILRNWLPPMCMITNACLNPFLFSFKNEEFFKYLKQFARMVTSRIYIANRRCFGKYFNKEGLYIVSVGKPGQNSSQLTLTESLELSKYTTKET